MVSGQLFAGIPQKTAYCRLGSGYSKNKTKGRQGAFPCEYGEIRMVRFIGVMVSLLMLFSLGACVSTYSQPLSKANNRKVFVQDRDVRHYKDRDPGYDQRFLVVPPKNPSQAGKPPKNGGSVFKQRPDTVNGKAPKQCRVDSDCPSNQKCIGASVRSQGTCRR